jgi:predicted alpha/beta-hydrolase family hydrolase
MTGAATTAFVYRAEGNAAGSALILAHGAGAGQRSSFLVGFAQGLSAAGLDVVTFNFLYTERGRRLPDRAAILMDCFHAVIDAVQAQLSSARQTLVIGGKSMGGRIATQVAAGNPSVPVAGLVLLGYPLHPPGRPAERRDSHLGSVKRPMLFVQGSRDAFGTPNEFSGILEVLSPPATLYVVEGGDHSFKTAGNDPARQAVLADVRQVIVDWIQALASRVT